MGALAAADTAESFIFSLLCFSGVNPLFESEVNEKIQEFIQKEKDPFGVYLLDLTPPYSVKASILDEVLTLIKVYDMMEELAMERGNELENDEFEIVRESWRKLCELLSNSGFKQTLPDSTIELLVQVMFEAACADTIDCLVDGECRASQLLSQLEAMGVIFEN